ncbi:hypothetical protein [Pelagibius sp.]|uniref:restriction endonuclease-related protein n=1 Tax=Pelagibius sp. TaxID=1931238 RepID=UPI003BB02B40
MPQKSKFYAQCEQLFQADLGYGRRWKSSAARALGIGRATLYRYFENDSAVPTDVHARLRALSQRPPPSHDDHQMVSLFARGLADLQDEIDANGWIKSGYPSTLQRVFDIAGARRATNSDNRWPTDLATLAALAQLPLYKWKIDLSWDPDGDFTAAALILNGETTQECADLAAPGRDPEAELMENAGYQLLMNICRNREDGQEVYADFRKFIITHPVIDNAISALATAPILTSVEGINEILYAFYQRVPEALCVGSSLPVCKVSGTILRRGRVGFHTEYRDPTAIDLAKLGKYDAHPWRATTMQLRRPFRRYWCLPGLTETALAETLSDANWACDLWPDFDTVDLTATSPNSTQQVAIDVKDYLSPNVLAARFGGFKQYITNYECYLVVPDYLPNAVSDYERRFRAARAALGNAQVALRTLSGLLSDLEVRL